MSTTDNTRPKTATALVVEALINEANSFPEHARLHLGDLFALSPETIFDELSLHLDPTVTVPVKTPAGTLQLATIPLTDDRTELLVPYLVGNSGTPNQGSAGYAAVLRDEVPTGETGKKVLLLLDGSPVETVRTTSQDASTLTSLNWENLAAAALGDPADPVLAAIRHQANRLTQDAETLTELLAMASDAPTAGGRLHRLGIYVRDPDVRTDPKGRLAKSVRWRDKLELWAAPDKDTRTLLRSEYPTADDPRAERVAAAIGTFGIDYDKFTLDDLPDLKPRGRLGVANPPRARDSVYANGNRTLAVWAPAVDAITVVLTGKASRDDHAIVRWADGSTSAGHIAPDTRDLTFDLPTTSNQGWVFGSIEVNGTPGCRLAVDTAPHGGWFAVEASLDIDTEAGAFTVGGAPEVLCIDTQRRILGQTTVTGFPTSEDAAFYNVTRGTDTAGLWLIERSSTTTDGPETDTGDPTAPTGPTHPDGPPADPDDPQFPEDPEGPTDPSTSNPTGTDATYTTVAFSRLADARTGSLEPELTFVVGNERVILGTAKFLTPQTLTTPTGRTVNGLHLEKHILKHPETLAWELTAPGADEPLAADQALERLLLTDLDRASFDQFTAARAAFFAAIEPHGSVHAVGANIATQEAAAYADAYRVLVDSIDNNGPFRAEFERVLLCDAVTDHTTGHLYLAPTNPVTVAFLLALNEATERWLPRASEVLNSDLNTITPRNLLPSFTRDTTWYQSAPDAPLPWRHYRPRSGNSVGSDGQDAYIARRIRHFLRVNPQYSDRRQVLSLAFHEPDNGSAVLGAMLTIFRTLARGNLDAVPNFSVTLINAEKQENELEAFLSRSATTPPKASDVAATRLMRDKVKVTTLPVGSNQGFAHISFAFRSPLERAHATFDLAARSGTLWADGLASTPGRLVQPGANETTYAWGTFVGTSNHRTKLQQLAASTLNLISGMPRDNMMPGKTRMNSTRTSHGFLSDIYDSSVWVVHLDRLLGLEAFAPRPGFEADRYLIDYEDRADPSQPGLDAITATKWVEPYRLTLRRALDDLGNPTEQALDRVLQLFNSVSGRWALDIIGAKTNALRERVGLAAAIAATQAFDNGFRATPTEVAVMVPIKEFFDALPRDARPTEQRSDDLLHLRADLTSHPVAITCRVLEVKWRTNTDPGAPQTARRQITATTAWLNTTLNSDGPGRLFRARDLAELLRGAVTRAEAFGTLPPVHDRQALEAALNAIGNGDYHVHTTFTAGQGQSAGDFISIEPDSSVAAHRQELQGPGRPMGHIRLGRPVLEALANGRGLTKPHKWVPTTLEPITDSDDTARNPHEETHPPAPPANDGADTQPAGDSADTDPAHQTASNPNAPDTLTNGTAPSQTHPATQPATTDLSELWRQGSDNEIARVGPKLDQAFDRYGLSVEPFNPALVQVGPSLLRFRTRAMGKLSITDIERRERDISREVGASGPVAVGDEPGYITVDVPREDRQAVHIDGLLPLLDAHTGKPGALSFISGVAPSGDVRISDLSRLPHLLVAGATGSGKSVFLRGLLLELIRARTPEELSLVIVDPKRLDFAPFKTAPHLRGGRILHDTEEALEILSETLASDLAWRQPVLEEAGVSSAAEFYESGGSLKSLPQLVIVVDEFADLILGGNDRRAFTELIQRFAQLTRAYGIFLVLATQRPSVDVITGSIKTNLSARIAFSLPSARDSMTVLDQPGAEDLLGDGDLVFYNAGRTERLQAPFVRPADVRNVLNT